MPSRLEPLYDTRQGIMQVAAFMSGGGSNIKELARNESEMKKNGGSPYNIAVIVTDNENGKKNASKISEEFRIPNSVIYSDFGEFRSTLENPKDWSARGPYFEGIVQELEKITPRISCLAFGGYEILVTDPLISAYKDMILNVHPADLTIVNEETGERKYIGNHAVLDQVMGGMEEICASIHIVNEKMDGGPVLRVSAPVSVDLEGHALEELIENPELANGIAEKNQNRLKEAGDWRIFTPTLAEVALGRIVKDANGKLFIKNEDGSVSALPLRGE